MLNLMFYLDILQARKLKKNYAASKFLKFSINTAVSGSLIFSINCNIIALWLKKFEL